MPLIFLSAVMKTSENIEKFYDTLEAHGVEIVEDFADIQIDDLDLTKVASETVDYDTGMGIENIKEEEGNS